MHKSKVLMIAVVVAVVSLVSACASKTPEERVAQERSRYSAKLNAFIVHEQPMVDEALAGAEVDAEEGDVAAEPEPAEGVGDQPVVVMEPIELRRDVELDLLVQHRNDKALPGITVDVTMADAAGAAKASWKIWVETAGLPQANQKQVSHLLEDVDYEDGDGFFAEVRHPVPAAERGEYREFSAADPG